MKHKYNTVKNTIENDRESGYKNSQYAVAELIDNSIQAGFKKKREKRTGDGALCVVDLIIIEEKIDLNSRKINRISKILVADNATGMDADTLGSALAKGESKNKEEDGYGMMGKFGYGLYMSSLSQCKRTDVYTWQNKKILHSWLDIDEILNSEIEDVPVEEITKIPSKFDTLFTNPKSDSGTLVVWSNLDKATWKTGEGIFRNVEHEIGRMNRYFLDSGKIKINFKQYRKVGKDNYTLKEKKYIRPNDPLYLMKNTNCPEPWHNRSGFTESPKEKIRINYKGIKGDITLKFAIAKEEFRGIKKPFGSKPWGRHARKNNGVSIIRAGRELELNKSWNNPSEPRERWANAEIHFDKSFDKLFRVTTNKQYARAIYKRDIGELATDIGKTEPGYLALLKDQNEEEFILTDISKKIEKRLNTLYASIKEWRKDSKKDDVIEGSPEDISTKARQKRLQKTKADKELEAAEKEKKLKAMMDRLIAGGMDPGKAKKVATTRVDLEISTVIVSEELPSPAFFEIKTIEGQYHIIINKNHPAYFDFFNLVEMESANKGINEPSSDRAIKLMLGAWASLEDEAISTETQYSKHLMDIRIRWGQIFRDLLDIKTD